jgi:threonine aldolase
METIDLRSDTVTLPGTGMLNSMMNAKVGDMVLGEDPSVNELEKKVASMFGMEDAAFCPSGTMTNQIAVNVHTRPGDEVICSRLAHVYLYEGGGIAFNSGASVSLIDTADGTFTSEQVMMHINPDDHHKAHSSLVCIENTVNMGGGKIWNLSELKRIREVCSRYSLAYHLDGARLFNAIVETKQDPKEFGTLFDSISICLSKGLGAPVGSLLIGSGPFIKRARRARKALGGTMRQAGFIAAAGLYALDNNIERLHEDHINSKTIYTALTRCIWVKNVTPPDTNIIIFEVADNLNSKDIFKRLHEKDILVSIVNDRLIRMVTHLNISSAMIEHVCKTLPGLV